MVWFDMVLRDKDGTTKWKTSGINKKYVVSHLTESGRRNYKLGKLKVKRGRSPY